MIARVLLEDWIHAAKKELAAYDRIVFVVFGSIVLALLMLALIFRGAVLRRRKLAKAAKPPTKQTVKIAKAVPEKPAYEVYLNVIRKRAKTAEEETVPAKRRRVPSTSPKTSPKTSPRARSEANKEAAPAKAPAAKRRAKSTKETPTTERKLRSGRVIGKA